ncbi:MAG: ROK family protein [Pseudorhodobacter sp.]
MFGGIDLGGTKIEACLHDADLNPLNRHRVPTPPRYEDLIKAVVAQVAWLRQEAGEAHLPVGLGLPGFVDHRTGLTFAANIDVTGRRVADDLAACLGERIPVENDGKCFVLSEANGGAGEGARTVCGLILGTGVSGGLCIDGALHQGASGLPGEIGHIGLPAALVADLDLPVMPCGCGRTGCYETLLAGPGLPRIAAALGLPPRNGVELAKALEHGDRSGEHVLRIWAGIAAELLHSIQLFVDPDCIVLGGGLTGIPGLAGRISDALESVRLPAAGPLRILPARFGDSSGVRGAALLARAARKQAGHRG